MSRFGSLMRALGLASSLMTLVSCQAIFGEYEINDAAFAGAGNMGGGGAGPTQTGPIRLSPTTGLYTTEWGGQATFTIVLDHAPTANVTVALSSSNTNEGTVTPTSVTFTKDDWKAPQVITVTGVDDSVPDFNKPYKIVTGAASSDDPSFNGVDPIDIELLNVDNETAGITVVPRSGLVTSEAGGQDTFTVVLNSKPAQDVTVSLTSSAPTEGTVIPESLVFTPLNWMAPQLVTVTGVDDGEKDPAHGYTISVTSKSDDKNYSRVAPISVAVTNLDNESAGVTVALVTGIDTVDPHKLRTSEHGDAATFTVALNAPPSADVVIPVSSSESGEGNVSPELLTFTPLNWNAPQTVAVMGVDDDGTADGDQPYTVVLGVPTGDDEDYTALAETEVPVVNVDNDKPGFTPMLLTGLDPQVPGKLLTTEAGTTATFTLALNSKPLKPVAISLSSSLSTEASVTPTSLTFTPQNWQSPQTVSVTGLNDDIQDGSPTFFVRTGIAVSEDPGYDMLDPPDIQVTNQDDDSAGVRVALAKGVDPSNPSRLVTDEYGSTATFTVALTSEPTEDVSIPVASTNGDEGVISPATLTFTKLNFRSPQTVTVTGRNDDVVDGNQPFAVSVGPATSNDLTFNGKFASQVQVTNRDDDSAGVIVTPTTGLTTSEGGKTDSFTIRLQSKPRDKVSIAVSSSNPAEGKPNVSSVTFTPDNWSANQTVIVVGQEDDGTQDGSPTYRIVLDPAQSNDPNYKGKPDPADVTVTNMDNDTAGVVVSPTSGLITSENGLKATFTIALASKPVGANVTVKIQLSSSRPSEGTVSPGTLTFDAVNWKSPQTVTVTGANDELADGPQPYMIITSPGGSIDGNYNTLNPSDVSVTNVDDDSAGVSIMPVPTATPAETSEKSGKATFTVGLTSLPTSEVTFTVTSLDTSEGSVSPATLKFTPTNGKTPQTVTVTGLDDDVADGDQQYTVRLSNGTSSDLGYSGKFGSDLPFINVDDDQPGLDIKPTSGLQTAELNETSTTFTVALRSRPTANVSIALSSSSPGEGKVSPTMLTFTSSGSSWSTPQTVTVTGVQDEVADGPQTYQVKLANAVSTDSNYGGKFGSQLDVTNIDDDQPGYNVEAESTLQTTEKGGKATFSVTLKSKPAGVTIVTLGLSSSNKNEGTVSPSSLMFAAADWNEPHVVTVTGVDDKKVDGDVSYQIKFGADMSYGAAAPAALAVTNVDDDTLGVLVASNSCVTTPGTTATFTIRLNSQPSAPVTIPLSSDTPMVGAVSPESLTFTSASGVGGWDTPQTVTVTGLDDMSVGMMTAYKIITGTASAVGETTGYDGFTDAADVSCTNTTP
jgi:Calx-beta domain-containing protein